VLNDRLDEDFGWRKNKSLKFSLRRVVESNCVKRGKKKTTTEEEEEEKKQIGRLRIEVFLRGCELE
jgi:hypothetical protein